MAEIKKDQERDELFRRIYKIATDLVHAGHVAEWDFKSYVLGTMFYRYISENFTAYINEGEYAAGNKAFDYAKMPDAEAETAREGLVQEKGFFILPSELFCNVLARADKDDNLNETLERVFNHIESSAASGDAARRAAQDELVGPLLQHQGKYQKHRRPQKKGPPAPASPAEKQPQSQGQAKGDQQRDRHAGHGGPGHRSVSFHFYPSFFDRPRRFVPAGFRAHPTPFPR